MAGRARRYEHSPSRVHPWLSSGEIFSRRQSICRCHCAPDVPSNLPKRNEKQTKSGNARACAPPPALRSELFEIAVSTPGCSSQSAEDRQMSAWFLVLAIRRHVGAIRLTSNGGAKPGRGDEGRNAARPAERQSGWVPRSLGSGGRGVRGFGDGFLEVCQTEFTVNSSRSREQWARATRANGSFGARFSVRSRRIHESNLDDLAYVFPRPRTQRIR